MLSCRGDLICWTDVGGSDYGQVRCKQGSVETSYTLQDYSIALATGADAVTDVCWLSLHGLVSCSQGTLHGSATQIGLGVTYGAQVFTSLTTYFAGGSETVVAFGSGNTLASGPYSTCESKPGRAYVCYASYIDGNDSISSQSFNFDSGTVSIGAAAFLSIHDGTLTSSGLPICGDQPCTFVNDDTGVLPVPVNTQSVASVRFGRGAACALYDDGTTACWGSVSIPTLSGVSDICVYDGGMCGVSGTSIECTGVNAFVDTYFAFPTSCTAADLPWNGICITCPSGSDIQQGTCTACPPHYYRSFSMASCTLCGPGSLTNNVTCTACGPAYDSNCKPCGRGSQSFYGTCSSCTLGTFRDTQTSCSTCLSGSLPSADATTCTRCPPPYALLYSSTAKTYADGTCTLAPDGYFAYGASWTLCDPGAIRTGLQPQCSTCPPGAINNASHTFCDPCPDGFVRNTGPMCYSCPSGLIPNSETSGCVKNNHRSIAPFRYAGFAIGGAGVLTTALFYKDAKPIVRYGVLIVSLLILVLCALL